MADRIQLAKSKFSDQAWNKINIALEANKTLQIFNLPKGQFTDAVAEDLCKFLTTNKTLIEFQFGRSRFTDGGLSSMLQALCENKTLEYFSLWESELDDTVVKDVCDLLKGNGTLKTLQFYKSRFTNEGTSQILRAFLNNNTLTCFSMFKSALSDAVVSTICKLVEENTSLSYLQFYESTFSDDGIDLVFSALTQNTTLTHLSIQQSTLSDSVVPALCKFITGNTTIQSLQLHKSVFSDDGMKKLLRAFLPNTSIVRFSIFDSVLTDDIVFDICTLLKRNTTCKVLQLYRSSFTDDRMSDILQALTSNDSLETFCVWDSELSDAAVPAICQLLEHNKKLTHLEIYRSLFTDGRIAELFDAFESHKSLTKFRLWDSTLSDGAVPSICIMLKQSQELEEFHITEMLHHGSIQPLMSLIESRTNLTMIKTFSVDTMQGVMLSKSDYKEPMEYLFKECDEEMKLLLPSQYLREDLKDWLLRESIPSAFDIEDNKLVLFVTEEGEHALKKSLNHRLMSVNSHFYTTYRIQTHKLALEVQGQCKLGECTPGSQLVFGGSSDEKLLCTVGAFLTDDNDNFYMLSSCHGFRIHHAYINEPNKEGVHQRVDIGSCVADVNQKDPLLDACLIQIKDKDLIAKCIPLFPGSSPKKAGLIGPYRGRNEDLAQMKTPEHAAGSIRCTDVMKYGATTKLTHGKLVYYDFSLPSAKISGALVTCTNEENSPFTASGDSGAVIFQRQGDRIQPDMSLHEALSVHCDVLKHLDDEKEVSLSFRLDVMMNYFENKLGKKLELLNIHF